MKPALLVATGILGGLSYTSLITSLAPVYWLKFNEASGNPVNYGSASLTVAQANCTQGQAGAGGLANEAYLWTGTAVVTITDAAAIDLTTFTHLYLIKPASAGELNTGRLFQHATNHYLRFAAATLTLNGNVDAVTTDAVATSTTTLTAGTGYWVAMTYDNAGDRKVHLYVNGVEVSYSGTPTAAVGDYVVAAGNLLIGNIAAGTTAYDGLMDEALMFPSALTAAQLLQIARVRPPNF